MSTSVRQNSTIVLKTILLALLRSGFRIGGWLAPGAAVRYAASLITKPQRSSRMRAQATVADDAVHGEIAIGSQRLATYSWGDPALQPYVLLAHGWSSHALRFLPWIPQLRAAGYAVVAFDQQGHGRSAGTHATLPDFTHNILAVGRHFGPAAALIAHSLGGAAATLALAQGLLAERVMLIAPSADPVAAISRLAHYIGLADHLCARIFSLFEARTSVSLASQQAYRNAPAIARPALIVHDLGDREVPWSDGECYARYWPHAGLLSTSGLGHHRIVCDSGVIDAGLRFLRGETIGARVVSTSELPYGVA